MGILSLVFCWVPVFPIVLALIGLLLSGAGMASANSTGSSKGQATAGLVMCIIALIPAIIILVIASGVVSSL